MKFLVVDDHVLIRQAMHGVLRKLKRDAVIVEAPTWKAARAALSNHPDINLVILDLTLPDHDGFEALAQLRESYPSISVVVVSAVQDRANVMKALDMGALGYIPTKYVTVGLSYTDGRNLDTFEKQQVYKLSLGVKY